ncbi:ARID DNA-binding domain-containing protein [Tanacetum coccineum]
MVRSKHVMKHNWLEYKPVQQPASSDKSLTEDFYIHKRDQVGITRKYLQRETPQRMLPWNSRKKSLSPGCKEMLLKRIKEIEAFNASKESTKAREHREGSGSTQKEKRARCYICKVRGHVFWKCPNKQKKAMFKKQKGIVKPTFKKVAEKIKYPEKVHVITDYMIEGTDDANWNETWMIGCSLHYMFNETRSEKAQEVSNNEKDGSGSVIAEHNKFLDEYFESIDQKEEVSLVKGLEELKWDRDDVQDYMDDEYISWNGSLYAIKVNSFSRFLSFMDLMKKDSMVYKHWDIFSKKYVEMLKWFYLVYLNYDRLDEIPPVVGVMEINLLSLHKIVDNLGGYLCVTLGDKWKTIASLQGLTEDDQEAIKGCYKRFIDMVQVYYETAKKPWYEKKPKEDVVESSSGNARVKDPQGKEKDDAGKEEALEEDMNMKKQFGVRLVGNMEKEPEEGSITDSNDFEVIFEGQKNHHEFGINKLGRRYRPFNFLYAKG